jgi:hypothetical protein
VTDQISGGRHRQDPGRGVPIRRGRPWRIDPPRPSNGPPRRLGLVVFAVLAVLFGYVLAHRPALPPPRADGSASASPWKAQPPAPWVGGRRSSGPAGLRLLVSGANPRVVDAATAAATPPPGIRLVPDAGVTAFPVGRSTIAVVARAWAAGSYLLLPGAAPMVLGRESAVSPTLDGQLIVVASPRGRTIVSGVGVDRRVRWQWQSPDPLIVLRDTPSGLVLQRFSGPVGAGELVLADRESGVPRRVLGRDRAAVAAGDRAAAWVPADCANPCSLAVSELRGGSRRDYPMPDGRMPESGAFSPDGRLLALTFPALRDGELTRPGYIGVLDVQTGGVVPVPELRTAPELGANLAWSPDSRWLVIGVNWPDHQTIAFWQPGGDLRVLATNLPGRAGPLTVLP